MSLLRLSAFWDKHPFLRVLTTVWITALVLWAIMDLVSPTHQFELHSAVGGKMFILFDRKTGDSVSCTLDMKSDEDESKDCKQALLDKENATR